MKTDLRRFAPLGLILSLLAVLSFIGILIVKGLSAGGVFILQDPKMLDQWLWVCIGVLVLGLALTALLDPDGARKFFVGRQVQYGSNALLMLVAFLGVLFFVNMLVYQYSSTSTPWDWTADKQNTLAPETLNILKTLPETVTVRAYYLSSDKNTETLLNNFKQNSNGKLNYEFINPNADPVRASNDGITRDATVVLAMGAHKELVEQATEQELDAAIIKLIHPTQLTIYFLTGHGERDITNAGETAFAQTNAALKNKNYTVKVLSLSNQQNIPDDAKALIIPGPQKPLTVDEVNIIEAYLAKGGALIVMEDPRQLTKFGDAPDPLANMLTKWGITLADDIVLDGNQSTGYLVAADPQNYGRHPITDKLAGYSIGYYTARSMNLSATPPQEIALTPLTQSLPNNVWGETDYKSIQDKTFAFNADTDIKAPLVLAAAAENYTTKARLVVFGDSDFATDGWTQRIPGMGDILLNAVDWSTQQENLINLTPKNNVDRKLKQIDNPTKIGALLVGICIIPLLIIFAGAWAWYSRRRRG
jgi:ABC-type uncharacterized transport system involved in gliding motility auxiliary subunit